jgi:hypothetical protein
MTVFDFLRSPLGRVARVTVGLALIAYGSTLASLVGLVLMMVGMVPAVTGLVDMCLIGEDTRSCDVCESERERHAGGTKLGFRQHTAHRGGSHV